MRTKPYNFDQSPKARLAYYKAQADEVNKRHNLTPAQGDWKKSRYPKPAFLRTGSIRRSEDGKKLFLDDLKAWTFGDYQDSHAIVRLDHTGWYADNFQDNLIRGAVVAFRNPHKENSDYPETYIFCGDCPSHMFYYPATYSSNWGGVTVYLDEYTDIRDCAGRADQLAEREAEDAREDEAKYQAEQQIDDLKIELHELNRETLAVIRELKQNSTVDLFEGKKALCRVIREHIEDVVERRGEIFKMIDDLTNNYWLAVE